MKYLKHRNRIHHLAPLSKIYEKYLCVSHFRLSDRIEIENFSNIQSILKQESEEKKITQKK